MQGLPRRAYCQQIRVYAQCPKGVPLAVHTSGSEAAMAGLIGGGGVPALTWRRCSFSSTSIVYIKYYYIRSIMYTYIIYYILIFQQAWRGFKFGKQAVNLQQVLHLLGGEEHKVGGAGSLGQCGTPGPDNLHLQPTNLLCPVVDQVDPRSCNGRFRYFSRLVYL